MIEKSTSAIKVEHLVKVFKIYDRPIDRLKDIFSPASVTFGHHFAAINDISFDVCKGEFLGIIGKNGAGKSTLLRILSGELTATNGVVDVRGRVSLLQLGVGFNRELNGIDNIRFAAKINGYSNHEFGEVIEKVADFADIGDFINRPVKYYSSGMYARLAFAVAINVNPDILIADEVLAVGDLRFASKCLRKMHELKNQGTTIILVTHDINKVALFCDRALWLDKGIIEDIGSPKEVIEKYRDYMFYGETAKECNRIAREGKMAEARIDNPQDLLPSEIIWQDLTKFESIQRGNAVITHAAIKNKMQDKIGSIFIPGENILIYLKIVCHAKVEDLSVGWVLLDKNSMVALHSNSKFCNQTISIAGPDKSITCCFDIKVPPLRHSEYIFSFGLKCKEELVFKVNDVFPIQIIMKNNRWRQGGYVIVENEDFYYNIIDC
jgi:ABC-type polysaccharide/polyol phosphate transport system ATPase subunit